MEPLESIDSVVARARKDIPTREQIVEESRRVIIEVLRKKADDISSAEFKQATLASSQLATAAREDQSRRAYEGVAVMMAREIATNTEERQRYIAATLPDHPMIKQMTKERAIDKPKA